jgi:hypothetical protein
LLPHVRPSARHFARSNVVPDSVPKHPTACADGSQPAAFRASPLRSVFDDQALHGPLLPQPTFAGAPRTRSPPNPPEISLRSALPLVSQHSDPRTQPATCKAAIARNRGHRPARSSLVRDVTLTCPLQRQSGNVRELAQSRRYFALKKAATNADKLLIGGYIACLNVILRRKPRFPPNANRTERSRSSTKPAKAVS